jgi:hypothetical protein
MQSPLSTVKRANLATATIVRHMIEYQGLMPTFLGQPTSVCANREENRSLLVLQWLV